MLMNLKMILLSLFLFTFTGVFGQKYYDLQWKKIEDNRNSGKFKSNLPILLEIQKQAMKDDNATQLIRSLKAEFTILNQTKDDEKNDAATQFFAKLQSFKSQFKGDAQMLYQVLIGEFFSDYYNENSWRINQSTNIDHQDFSQIETWSKLDFKNFLAEKFTSLKTQKESLKKVSIAEYKSIFDNTDDLEFFPTLFEWNAINHISFLRNTELFTPNEIKNNQLEVTKIYQDLIQSNSGNAQLYFRHKNLSAQCEFSGCTDRLIQLENLLNQAGDQDDYAIFIIKDITSELRKKDERKSALKLIENAKKKFSKSQYINTLLNEENEITNPFLTLYFEKHTLAQQPIHLVAEAKNVNAFSLNIYSAIGDENNFLIYAADRYNKGKFRNIKKNLVRTENFELQNLKDYKSHKTSFEIESLPPGIYVGEYVVEHKIRGDFYFIVTNSRIIFENQGDRRPLGTLYKLVNRANGQSIAKMPLKIYEFADRTSSHNYPTVTDANATFKFPDVKKDSYYRYYLVQQPSTNEYNLIPLNGNRTFDTRELVQERTSAQIFLDRGIYRPGQIVYFKVINTQLLNHKESVKAGLSQEIALVDANGEILSSQNFTTNDFGSYHGSFVLPKGKLNGQFSLQIRKGNAGATKYFHVEEYKRPKFEVIFDPVKDEYKYGETLLMKGKAVMFSGVPLSNAVVDYEIKKNDIRWRYFWWFPRGNDNQNSILGMVKTNDKGEFTIEVKLQKDETKQGIQVDNYQINAIVTDLNGETQSATNNIKVASVSHYISIEDIPDTFTDEAVKLAVNTRNYNDQDLKKSYRVHLAKMQPKTRVFRTNFESRIQDLPFFSKNEFIQKFPYDYFSESEKENQVQTVLINGETREDKSLDLGKLDAGKYELTLYNVEGKDTIQIKKTFDIYDKRFLKDSQNPFLKIIQAKTEYHRQEKAKFYLYSAIPKAIVNIFIQDGSGKTITEHQYLHNGILLYEVSLPKDETIDRMNVQFQIIAFNDIQTQSFDIQIKSDTKPMRIETVTFRDKLEPGITEKWTIKILGDDHEKINAEVLANMYDQSLDQFAPNYYQWQKLYRRPFLLNQYGIAERLIQKSFQNRREYLREKTVRIPQFNWLHEEFYGSRQRLSGVRIAQNKAMVITEAAVAPAPIEKQLETSTGLVNDSNADSNEMISPDKIQVRQNLNETAFFYPNLLTDSNGDVTFEFTSPEALTQWKMMFLAHTKDARAATLEKTVVTQKEFSVTPNYPRFLREGDQINFQSKISSLVDKKMRGKATLQILDAITNQDITANFKLNDTQKTFDLEPNGNTAVTWKLETPNGASSIIIKVVAAAGSYSDGEQKAIAVLPNRMLVTDAIPIFVKQGQTKTFNIENLVNNQSSTATNFANTLELTTNPIWEIMFALPSLKYDSDDSADVLFNKWFADVLAAEIFKANPKLKSVFDEYQDKGLLNSNLEKNQELKQLLLDETPWVLESNNETEQMQKLARLFDANTMRNSINSDWAELVKIQNPDGGFSWYPGYQSSYSSSLYILKNLGKINQWLNGKTNDYQSTDQQKMVSKLIRYLDSEVNKYWDIDKKWAWSNYVFDYLDARNYWENKYPLTGKGAQLKSIIIQKAPKAEIRDFTFFGLHRAVLLFDAYGLPAVSKKLLTYLKETSTETATQGVYWKKNLNDWGWYASKTVNHAGALEAFNKLSPADTHFIEEMKIWLITQKEVNSWKSSRATAEVIFTILNSGQSWTDAKSDRAEIVWAGKSLTNPDTQATGYVKSTMKPAEINPALGTVTVTKPGAGIVQGGLFWQYYEDLDKIKSTETYISITKELYKKVKTVNGEQLMKITPEMPLQIGDKITVRMILNTDRAMEFIHLKDMRAAGFEPLNVISGYQWKNGLGYYQSTKDASTNFYIQYMPKGKYVFEYDYVANAAGTFSNGITTLQNYYAPQMNSHTKGTKVKISE